jgi:hypothetical protein
MRVFPGPGWRDPAAAPWLLREARPAHADIPMLLLSTARVRWSPNPVTLLRDALLAWCDCPLTPAKRVYVEEGPTGSRKLILSGRETAVAGPTVSQAGAIAVTRRVGAPPVERVRGLLNCDLPVATGSAITKVSGTGLDWGTNPGPTSTSPSASGGGWTKGRGRRWAGRGGVRLRGSSSAGRTNKTSGPRTPSGNSKSTSLVTAASNLRSALAVVPVEGNRYESRWRCLSRVELLNRRIASPTRCPVLLPESTSCCRGSLCHPAHTRSERVDTHTNVCEKVEVKD